MVPGGARLGMQGRPWCERGECGVGECGAGWAK